MNPSAISTTEAVDAVFYYIFGICGIMLVAITAAMIWFVVKYNRKHHPRPEPSPRHHVLLETAWTVIPTIIVMTMFWYGWEGYTTLTNVPEDALEVKVTGRMWSWKFDYPNGRSSERLVVPVNRAIKLDITSQDVLHSFYVPSFRIKRDAVPGMTTHAWFRAPATGEYDAFCTEYCGVGHSAMITMVEARTQRDFDTWYNQPMETAEKPTGKSLLAKHGCTGCHSLDGSKMVGPTLRGIFGREVTVTTGGKERTLTVDEEYIRRSILQPQADLVKGFPPVMPSFEGTISAEDLKMIVDFLKGPEGDEEKGRTEKPHAAESPEETGPEKTEEAAEERAELDKAAGPKKVDGASLARGKGCLACHSTDGSRLVGPSFKGLFGRQATVLTGGKERTVTADAEYIERSLREPQADVAAGYPPAMPAFPDLSEEEMAALVSWLKTLE